MSQKSKTDKIVIRKMAHADLLQVEAHERANFSQPWPSGSFAYELRPDSFSTALVAVDTAKPDYANICGVIVAWRIVDSLEIATISVAKEYRHMGIARSLLAQAISLAEKDGIVEAILEVRASNQDALHLYLGLGFEVLGIRPGYYQDNNEDALLLTLKPIDFEKMRNLICLDYV
ncbi:MAG TPA: ribosomal protein S18-alanine N-acetyltransferase [Anaerolineaceae bacterium]|nr:ribosomal protein S18-alanine N-acetyltransferase [Anaerolineaceae bacterium]